MKALLTLFLVIGSGICASLSSAAQSPRSHPRAFCEFAADLGYPSRGYKEHTGGCASNMIDVTPTPGKNGLRNNLAFYSMGEIDAPSKLERVSLILNVNNRGEKAKAYVELARVATAVATKLMGKAPKNFAQTVMTSGSKTWRVGEWEIEVKSKTWPTGLGQDTSVYFRPPSAS